MLFITSSLVQAYSVRAPGNVECRGRAEQHQAYRPQQSVPWTDQLQFANARFWQPHHQHKSWRASDIPAGTVDPLRGEKASPT